MYLVHTEGTLTVGVARVADMHHFNADPDPGFHFNADPAFQLNTDTDPALLGLHCERPRLYFEPKKLLNSDLNVDPDPASKVNSDPDPQPWGAWLPEFETALKGGAVLWAGLLQAGQRVLIPAQ